MSTHGQRNHLGIDHGARGTIAVLGQRGDALEADMVAGAIAALRRRAQRQRDIADKWGPGAGEAAVALRIVKALEDAAADLERDARTPVRPCPTS